MVPLSDWRLDSFGQGVYALSLPLRPGSVRDSMFRAERFCAQLLAAGAVLRDETALVVGAGPVGMSVTAALLRADVKVVSCNSDPEPDDEAMMNCRSRFVAPATYDFPAFHWTDKNYPLADAIAANAPAAAAAAVPRDGLAWSHAVAEEVVSSVRSSLDGLKADLRKRRDVDYFVVEPGVLDRLDALPPKRWPDGCLSPALRAVLRNTDTGQRGDLECRVVILCTGGGAHVTRFTASGSDFAGFGWWSEEDEWLDEPSLGAGRSACVLGGGDAGVADFVRLLTGRADPDECLDLLGFPADLLAELVASNRAMWSAFEAKGVADHDLLLRSQVETIEAIDRAWRADPKLGSRASELVLPADRRPAVQLALKCQHFGVSYAGNRIAAQLLARAVASGRPADNAGLAPFRINVSPSRIAGVAPHRCVGDPQDCAAAPHEITFVRSACDPPAPLASVVDACRTANACEAWKATVDESAGPATFDRVLVRFKPELRPVPLPANVKAALAAKRRRIGDEIRDVPPFYLW